jgi:hypothetical protein
MSYVHAVLTAGTDFAFVFLPIPLMQHSAMNFREKVIIGGMLMIGTM